MDITLPEGIIDFKGQELSEKLFTYLLTLGAIIAYLAGFILQDIFITLYTVIAFTILTFIVVVPPYKFYNTHPITYLKKTTPSTDSKIDIEY